MTSPLRALVETAKRLFARRSAPLGRSLESERASHFFTWFGLTPSGAPDQDARGIWTSFRPGGTAFPKLAALAVLTDRRGRIVETRLGLDRAFLDDRRTSPFARDLAKSFLLWALPETASAALAPLIANIGDVAAGGATVIMRVGALDPPPPDRSGGYPVFLGTAEGIEVGDGAVRVGLRNFPGSLPPEGFHRDANAVPAGSSRWLRLDVRGI